MSRRPSDDATVSGRSAGVVAGDATRDEVVTRMISGRPADGDRATPDGRAAGAGD